MSAHFKLWEFASPTVVDGRASYSSRSAVPPKYVGNVRRVMGALEVIRTAQGDKPMRIASGWRSPEFNKLPKPGRKTTGKAKRSKHLTGEAADLTVKGVSPARLYWVIRDLIKAGQIPAGGLACYPNFVHYDIRGRLVGWRPAPPRPKRGIGSR